MARKGMALGSGRGYKNIVGRDPAVHSQSAKGMKQPQSVNIIISPALKKKSYKDLKRNGIFLSKNGDADNDGVKNSKDCKPLNSKKQDDELVKEIKYDPSVDEEKEPTTIEKIKGRAEALAQRGFRAGKEAYSNYQKEKEKKESEKNEDDVEIAQHPIISKLEKQKQKINALNEKISNLPEDSDNESELFEKLEQEQADLDELTKYVENIKLEDYSDKQLKELAVRHESEKEVDWMGTPKPNQYEAEYIRRIDRRKKVADDLNTAEKEAEKKHLAERPIERFSDLELKRLGNDPRYITESMFGDSHNRYKDELAKRTQKRKELNQHKPSGKGFFEGIF